MKPRIKLFADKAQEIAEWTTPQGLEWFDAFKEQFAKMIIQECHEVIVVGGVDDLDGVMKHFEIE